MKGSWRIRSVTLLFILDDSGSMEAIQQRLLDSFPGFIAAIQASLAEVDGYHVGVMTSDAYYANEAGCTQLGALVTQTEAGPHPALPGRFPEIEQIGKLPERQPRRRDAAPKGDLALRVHVPHEPNLELLQGHVEVRPDHVEHGLGGDARQCVPARRGHGASAGFSCERHCTRHPEQDRPVSPDW